MQPLYHSKGIPSSLIIKHSLAAVGLFFLSVLLLAIATLKSYSYYYFAYYIFPRPIRLTLFFLSMCSLCGAIAAPIALIPLRRTSVTVYPTFIEGRIMNKIVSYPIAAIGQVKKFGSSVIITGTCGKARLLPGNPAEAIEIIESLQVPELPDESYCA